MVAIKADKINRRIYFLLALGYFITFINLYWFLKKQRPKLTPNTAIARLESCRHLYWKLW